ncbi:MAG: CTP synthase [Proteobacteria bacterium]|nr:CTP synthase [Pseudomonadota bacterium]
MTRFIFVTGGVVSSLGKGIATASIGAILKSMNYKVVLKKLDPYLNIDPGTMNPSEHGEVFVTDDGAECDLDLGHYERFTNISTTKESNVTSGKIYQQLIQNERQGKYLGQTVQTIPHVTDLIAEFITHNPKRADFIICEVGGTVGDIEALPFFETIRQVRQKHKGKTMLVHLTYVPYLATSKEIKTKPTQHSVKELMSIGLAPDALLCRSSIHIGKENKRKIALSCNVEYDCVFEGLDVKSIYEIPPLYVEQNMHGVILKHFDIENYTTPNLEHFSAYSNTLIQAKKEKKKHTIAIIGKYTNHADAYKSICESIEHACVHFEKYPEIIWINSEEFTEKEPAMEDLKGASCVIIPGGFGTRGIEGKIKWASFLRKHNIPTLGICLGMHIMVIEFARTVLGIANATSAEWADSGTKIIDIIEQFEKDGKVERRSHTTELGGTMRLGNYTTHISNKNTLAYKIYGEKCSERHRHRYEVDATYKAQFEEKGMLFSVVSTDNLPEIVEVPTNNFFIGVQFHPEFKSSIKSPSPLFKALIEYSL